MLENKNKQMEKYDFIQAYAPGGVMKSEIKLWERENRMNRMNLEKVSEISQPI